MPTRLSDYGYHVSTGQLVWNRYKPQLRIIRTNNEFPVIWAESVTSRGFSFTAKRRNHAPYIEIHNCPHLITHKECVLLHRTTSKEQGRRLLSAVIPQEFIDQTCGVVIENHLNIVYSNGDEEISFKTISTILNSKSVDQAFRCISGSVAVSVYELESLPLPTVNQVKIIESMIRRGDDSVDIDAAIASFYENKNK
jgi:hypothetical protein